MFDLRYELLALAKRVAIRLGIVLGGVGALIAIGWVIARLL
jgi:hypothetical protein